MRLPYFSARAKLGWTLGGFSLVSIGLYAIGPWQAYEADFFYMIWNLGLAWTGLLAALWLERSLQHHLWSSWYALAVTALWLVFLPNTFYMLTDFIHLRELTQADLMTGLVMLSTFILNGMVLGLLSVHIVHRELLKRVSPQTAALLVGLALLTCSFAIYVGRELRWNTWDIFLNPSSLLFDVSERLLHPTAHPHMWSIVLGFFVLLSSLYAVAHLALRATRQQPQG